jgi:hypothetical protein
MPRRVPVYEGYVNDIKFIFDFSLGSNIKKMYYGIYEFYVREALKKYLKPGGVFLDIGANVGYLTAFGMSLVGKEGTVHSFEPIPAYYERLLTLARLNPEFNFVVNNMALGESNGQISITKHKHGLGGSSIIPGFVPQEHVEETFPVTIGRLDSYLEKCKISNISLIKIDTEGFELPVLLGTSGFFDKSKGNLPPIVAEITPAAFKLMGKSLRELSEFMGRYGYKCYDIFGSHRIDLEKMTKGADVLFRA